MCGGGALSWIMLPLEEVCGPGVCAEQDSYCPFASFLKCNVPAACLSLTLFNLFSPVALNEWHMTKSSIKSLAPHAPICPEGG